MEIWDLYDENGQLTGETMARGEKGITGWLKPCLSTAGVKFCCKSAA